MNEQPMPDLGPNMNPGTVSVYGGNAADDFPVLKAFQQYIDAEQEKARKRMALMCAVFGFVLITVIAFFVVVMRADSQQLQKLNDRLVEFAMKDRDRGSAVVVQPPQDNAAILQLTEKLEKMQQKMDETRQAAEAAERARIVAEKKAAEAAQAALPKPPSPEQTEIARLKAQLVRERAEAETAKKLRREEELEAYRRKHYPELYATPKPQVIVVREPAPTKVVVREPEEDEVETKTLTDDDAISYFEVEDEKDTKKGYALPVEVKGVTGKWRIPND